MATRHSPMILPVISVLLLVSSLAAADIAPDPTDPGPYSVGTGYYRSAAAVMPEILADRSTEIWAEAQWPVDAPKPWPVIVMLHGNHGTCGTGTNPRRDSSCEYTMSGTCPSGYVVTPNHQGYRYFTERLASWGYFVISINANRGITCGAGIAGDSGLNLARGRLILKHLEKLSVWSTGGEATPATLGIDLSNALDFSKVGLGGHSRGGEGARAAYVQYLDPGSQWPDRILAPVGFKGIFEIGAVDGQTSRVLDATGTAWNQVLPECDGDVSNLQGVKPFDRMMDDSSEKTVAPKSTFTVWGANHNFFNTEWQESDSSGCYGHTPLFPQTMGSPEQRSIGMAAAMGFFRTHLDGGAPNPDLIRTFDPLHALPPTVSSITNVDRAFILSPNASTSPVLDDFRGSHKDRKKGVTVSYGTVPEHDTTLKSAKITWKRAGSRVYFANIWSGASGRSLTGYDTLDFRISRSTSSLNPASTVATDFSLALFSSPQAISSRVSLSAYTELMGPVGRTSGNLHSILQTVRIPLASFTGIDLGKVRGMVLNFDKTTSGEIYIADVRLGTFTEGAASLAAGTRARQPSVMPPLPVPSDQESRGTDEGASKDLGAVVTAIEHVPASSISGGEAVEVSVELRNGVFPVRDSLVVLQVGDLTSDLSRYPNSGETNRLIFTFPASAFETLQNGVPVSVYYGEDPETSNWKADAGLLNK